MEAYEVQYACNIKGLLLIFQNTDELQSKHARAYIVILILIFQSGSKTCGQKKVSHFSVLVNPIN